MMSRPAWLAGFVAFLGLAASGCTSHAADPAGASQPAAAAVTPSAAPSDSRTPLQILQAGVPTEKSPIYRFSIKSAGRPEHGVIDPPDQIAEIGGISYSDRTYTETTVSLFTRDKSWMKVIGKPAGRSGLPTKWMAIDPQKMKLKNGTPYLYVAESDPGYTADVFDNATIVERAGPGRFRGVTDLSDTGAGKILSAAQLKALGDKAAHLAFTAVLDDQGRLTSATVVIPAAGKLKASTAVITYDQYGTAAKPTLPTAAEQVKAPSTVYKMYGY